MVRERELLAMSNNGIIRLVKNACEGIARLVFPPSCVFCGVDLQSGNITIPNAPADSTSKTLPETEIELCSRCIEFIRPNYAAICQACGAGYSEASPKIRLLNKHEKTVASDGVTAFNPTLETDGVNLNTGQQLVPSCIHCRRLKMQFQHCYALGNYEKGIRDAVLTIKSGANDPLAAILAQLIANKISSMCRTTAKPNPKSIFDLVIPIPIFWRRRLTRKTIVSELIARRIALQLKVPYDCKVLRYNRLTEKQGTLSNTERTKNVAGAIELVSPKKVKSKTVLIVDDVMTSGATLNEASRVCLQAGAQDIYVAIVARGIGLSLTK